MRTWEDLREEFRSLTEGKAYLDFRVDHFFREGWEQWNLAGGTALHRRFSSVARMAGTKLLDAPLAADYPELANEPDGVHRWYKALRDVGRSYGAEDYYTETIDGKQRITTMGRIDNVCAASADLCLEMESLLHAASGDDESTYEIRDLQGSDEQMRKIGIRDVRRAKVLDGLRQQLGVADREGTGQDWIDESFELLKRIDSNTAQEFDDLGTVYEDESPVDIVGERKKILARVLKGFEMDAKYGRVREGPEHTGRDELASTRNESSSGNTVFLVHGHDAALKETVARYLEKLKLNCVILHEQTDEGRTVIEKFVDHAIDSDFAVALWTADDVGRGKSEKELKKRPRQTVVFETGFLLSKLGRNKVCVIYESGVEIPSDYKGVIYISAEEEWKLRLAREMKAANLPVDLNDAV